MLYCHACDAQFPDEHARCLHCGGRLWAEPPGAQPLREPPPELRLLARRQPLKAVPLLEALSAAEIDFTLVGDGGTERVNADWGSYGQYAAIEVYVAPTHLAEAEAALRDELAPITKGLPEPAEAPPSRCPACGSPLPEVAMECLDCGLVFDTSGDVSARAGWFHLGHILQYAVLLIFNILQPRAILDMSHNAEHPEIASGTEGCARGQAGVGAEYSVR